MSARGIGALVLGGVLSATLASCNLVLGIDELPVRSTGGAGGTDTTSSSAEASTTVATASSSTGCASGTCGPTCAVRCDGNPCDAPGQCESQSCVDGVCCAGSCDSLCKACDVEGKKGTCSPVPAGKSDASCAALGQPPVACDGAEHCVPAPGSPCGPNFACASGVCVYGLCKYALATACENDLDCATNLCDDGSHLCVQCAQSGECNGTQCVVAGSQQVCLLENGAYCGYDTQCNSMNCNPSSHVCI